MIIIYKHGLWAGDGDGDSSPTYTPDFSAAAAAVPAAAAAVETLTASKTLVFCSYSNISDFKKVC